MLKADNQQLVDGAGDVLHLSGIPRRRYHGYRLNSLSLRSEEVFSPCGGAALYDVAAFKNAGGFDERYFMYVEDIDLGFRLQLAGYRCLFVPEARVHHIGSATTGRESAFSVYHGHRNLVWNYFKNMPLGLLLLGLPLHLIATLLLLVTAFRRGQGTTMLKAKRDALLGLPDYLRERQKTIRNVSVSRILGVVSVFRGGRSVTRR